MTTKKTCSSAMMFNGTEITIDELTKKLAELKVLRSLAKEAKKAGLVGAKTVAKKQEKSANFNLMLAQFTPIVNTNQSIIAALFKEFVGQDSISFNCDKEYNIIIRNKTAAKIKKEAQKVEKEEAQKKEIETKIEI